MKVSAAVPQHNDFYSYRFAFFLLSVCPKRKTVCIEKNRRSITEAQRSETAHRPQKPLLLRAAVAAK